jgi:predicted HAD superfamily Cof-like phosphohydrolase
MIDIINLWFKKAVPNPTDKNRAVQIGVHLEEVREFHEALAQGDEDLTSALNYESLRFKTELETKRSQVHNLLLLDSLCDQIVTAIGVAYMNGFDISGALQEVNRSNWSKFVDGTPVFDENGKIKKGPNYSPPDLSKFI